MWAPQASNARPVGEINASQPDYILILPWNLKDEIVSKCDMRETGEQNSFVPIPAVTVDP